MNRNINEVNNKTASMMTSEEIKYNFKKPIDISLKAKDNYIVQEAISEKSYDKLYYQDEQDFKNGNPARRTKRVQLPLNREGILFTNVHALWEHLQKNCGYRAI